MGYPMTYIRIIDRSRGYLKGGYTTSQVAGDLRRLERDSRDGHHQARYAELAHITPAQAKIVLDAFFAGLGAGCARPHEPEPCDGTCGVPPLPSSHSGAAPP